MPGSHAGVLFMHNEGYSTMCGHGVIAVTTIALERGLLMPGGDGTTIVYDSPAGTIRARARRAGEAGRAGAAGRGDGRAVVKRAAPGADGGLWGDAPAAPGRARGPGGGRPHRLA